MIILKGLGRLQPRCWWKSGRRTADTPQPGGPRGSSSEPTWTQTHGRVFTHRYVRKRQKQWKRRELRKALPRLPSPTVVAGHLQVGDEPQQVVHLVGPLLRLQDAVRGRGGRVDVDHVQQVDPWRRTHTFRLMNRLQVKVKLLGLLLLCCRAQKNSEPGAHWGTKTWRFILWTSRRSEGNVPPADEWIWIFNLTFHFGPKTSKQKDLQADQSKHE